MLPRELHLPAPRPGVALWTQIAYADNGLAREEILTTSSESDAYYDWQRRLSADNGKTWTEPEDVQGVTLNTPAGGMVTYPRVPASPGGTVYRFLMRRLWPGNEIYTYQWGAQKHELNDHVFVTEDGGPERLLRYEDGPDYDPAEPFAPAFCRTNQAYAGQNAAAGPDGAVFFPLSTSRDEGETRLRGVCLMRRDPESEGWQASNQQFVDLEVSCRGMLEPDVAVLRSGAVMVVCRGSNTDLTAGRKWLTVSTDGGKSLAPIEELRYDDGSRFYSPSSIHRFLRSTRNGKLYWLANIVAEPPRSNHPRYPLCLAEIDEERLAVRKDSVIIVDDRGADEPERLQLSNFNVIEDRESLDFEIYVSRLGQDVESFWETGVYRYVFSPPPPKH